MGRLLKLGAAALGLALYVWFAAVKGLEEAKRRKLARRAGPTRS